MALRIVGNQEVNNKRGRKFEGAMILVGGATELDVDHCSDDVHNHIL